MKKRALCLTLILFVGFLSALLVGCNRQKRISFIGDSISTYRGYSNSTAYNKTIGDNKVWYPNKHVDGADMSVKKTWWHRTCKNINAKLCVNNSISGLRVSDEQCYDKCAHNLHNKRGVEPDIIVVFIGINDFSRNVPIEDYSDARMPSEYPVDFGGAYRRMLLNIESSYPHAKLFCCTLLFNLQFDTPENDNGVTVYRYNEEIRAAAEQFGATVVDLSQTCITFGNFSEYSLDGLHPNEKGMEVIAEKVSQTILACI